MYFKIFILTFGFCGGVMCPPNPKRSRSNDSSAAASRKTKGAVTRAQDVALGIEPDVEMVPVDEVPEDQGSDASARLQASILQLGDYADKIISSLTEMSNSLGAALGTSSETVDSLVPKVSELSDDVKSASSTASTVIAVAGAVS